ncbi:hypothetical protein [Novosphingobium sp.]|uniref:hypothetical protein n=1 Tax=Novosphingobium sp. TaxID=1874826 RepID=UPI0025CD4733|nr:hypothetical protein [Novosphingobium sp.]MCC6925435.1 hypothetical protein [Novosphingobium sp.]
MNKITNTMLVAFGAFALQGCATVMHGANQDFEVKTDPDGATVKMTNGFTCTSPCKTELPRRHDLRVDIAKEGYRPVYVLVQSKLGGATFGNIIAGGLIGGIVDSSNGATNQLTPNPVIVKLVPMDGQGQEVLFDKKGKELGTVAANNDKVRVDVAKTIGNEAAGLSATGPAATPTPEPASSPAPTGG